MSENLLQSLLQTFLKVSNSAQTNLSQFIRFPNNNNPYPVRNDRPFQLLSLSSHSHSSRNLLNSKLTDSSSLQPTEQLLKMEKTASPVQGNLDFPSHSCCSDAMNMYPDNPTRQQKKDVKELMAILSRMYPCKECADHFKEVLRVNPIQAGSHHEFSQWLCHVLNVVNRSLGKVVFPCERVDARWGKLECEQRACDLQGTTTIGSETV